MRKRLLAVILCASMIFPVSASAEVLGYEATLNTYTQEKKSPQQFQIDDGAGNTVNALAKTDTLYVTAKNTAIRSNPGESGAELRSVLLGTKLERVAVCDNGWSKVTFQKDGEDKIIGYVQDSVLSDTETVNKFTDTVTAAKDSDILDYPGRKDGEVVGEVLQDDELKRTGTVDDIWSRIVYTDDSGAQQTGYIPTSCLEGYQETEVAKAEQEKKTKAGSLTKSSGEGIFADAVDGVTSTGGSGTSANGVKDRNSGISFFRCDTETFGNFPYYPLLPMQYLLWPLVKWNHIYRCNGNNQPHHSSRPQSDSIWFQGGDQWTGLRGGGLRWCDPDQLY